MLYNNNYYNSYKPYNSSNNVNNTSNYRSAPLYSNVETETAVETINPINNQDFFNDNVQDSQESSSTKSTSNRDKVSIFGLSLGIDDIIIIGIAIFLFMENKKDYLLLIILGLLFFDISLDTIKNMSIFKHLFNPT